MLTPAEPDFVKMVEEKIEGNHFMHYVGYKITNIGAGSIEAELELQPHHRQQMGFMHGGVTATLADVVSGFAAFTLVKRGQGVVTVDLKISYLNPGAWDKVYAKGYVIKTGRMLHFCEAELWMIKEDGERIDIAKSSAVMATVELPSVKN